MFKPQFLRDLTELIGGRCGQGVTRVAITGIDGVGKTSLADALAPSVEGLSPSVIRASIDGFHNPRAIRYARGRRSPEGFYRDSYDIDGFHRALLDPLAPGGDRRYRSAIFEHRTDRIIEAPIQVAPTPSVLLVDGIFLLRPELIDCWELTIFLDAPFATAFERLAIRDGLPADPHAEVNDRYRLGQGLYFEECDPKSRADVLVDYTDFDRPLIVRRPELPGGDC